MLRLVGQQGDEPRKESPTRQADDENENQEAKNSMEITHQTLTAPADSREDEQ